MAYSIYYGKELLYDPFSGDTLISDVQLTGSTNAAAYLDFTIAPNHLLIDKIQEKGENVEVYSDKTLLFRGYIENITENFDKSKDVSCVNALAWLNDIKLRPYSTDQDEVDSGRVGLIAPGGLDALFDWYIQQYNERQPDVSRHFRIRVNQADRLTEPNWADITQTGFTNTGEEIDDKILSYGGYLSIAYSDSSDELLLDLYADAYEANNQVIDFGVNLLDYTKEITTDNQYTAIIPLGATLDLDPEQPIYCHIKYSDTNPPASKSAMKSDYSTYVGVYADYESSDYNGVGDNPSDADIINHYTWSNFEQSTRNGGLPIPCVDGFSLYLHVAYASSDDGFTNFSAWNYSGRAYMGYYVDLRSVDSGDPADYGWTSRGNALGPSGNQTYQPPSKMSQAVNLSSIPDGVAGDDADFYKKGDAVYSISAVDKYGYREMDWSNNNISDPYKLRDESVVELRKNMDPEITLTIKAIDLALFMDDGYEHLDIGQAARVRSRPHNIDEYLIVSDIVLDLSDPSNTSYTLGHGVDTLTGKTSGFITALNNNTNKALDRLDPISEEAKNAAKDAENAANAAGKAVVSIQEQFYQSDSPTELTGGSWQPTNIWVQGKYTWRRSYVTYGNMETEYQPDENGVCISGNTGEQGIPGPAGQDGQDGKTTYFHIKYSNVSNPTEPDQLLEVPAEYIGTYVDFEELDSTDPTKYTWAKFEGTDGEDGIPGTNGQDGKTSYLHIAYASTPDGETDFSTTDPTDRLYLGQYVDFNEEDSQEPSMYTWARIKGDSGPQGEQGIQGPPGQDGVDGVNGQTSYFHVKYAPVSNPTSEEMTETPNTYIGTYVDFVEEDSTDPNDYTWVKIEGLDGADGIPGTNGLDGNTSYLHIAYATSADGTEGFSTTESEGKTYIGQYVDFTEEDSLTPSSYSWSKIKGEDGADGDQGPEGPQGPPGQDGAPGADGQTSYFHIKYSHIPNPTDPDDISDVPNTYIGTYVDFNPVSSTNPSDYTWMQLQGSEGPQGIPGAPGEDGAPGVTSYLHIAYATAPDGSTGFSTTDSEGKTYLGTCVDTNPDDPETPSSYTWVRFKGDQGDQGPEGPQGPPGQDGQDGQDGEDGQMIYCTCTTSGSITAKVATPIDATVTSLYVGMTISVKFTYANTASSPTLNLSGLGAKPILVNGVRYAYWAANMSVIFVYDGTNWNSCSVPVYANTATIGNPVSKNVYIDGTGVDIRNGTTVLSSFAEDEIHLGLNSNEAMIYLADDTVSLTSAYIVHSGIGTGTEDSGPGLYIECPGNQPLGLAFRGINSYGKNAIAADQYLGFYNNYTMHPSGIVIKDTASSDSAIYMESPDIEFVGNAHSTGDWSYNFENVNVVRGYFMDYSQVGCIKRPAIVIGTDNQNAMLLSSSNKTLPLTTTYFDWGSPASSTITSYGGVRLYRSGSYVYVQVGKQSSATDRQVCLWISGTSRFQGVTSSNGALEVNVATYTSGGSIIYNGIEDIGNVSSCPNEGGMFLQLVIPELPVVLRAPTSGTYTYRISLEGRSSNSTGQVQTTRLVVRVQ